MLTKDIKKGMRVQLNNGWFGTMMDNGRGVTRVMEVEGIVTEMGSCYTYDIVGAQVNGKWVPVELTQKEKDMRRMVKGMFGG